MPNDPEADMKLYDRMKPDNERIRIGKSVILSAVIIIVLIAIVIHLIGSPSCRCDALFSAGAVILGAIVICGSSY